MKRYALAGLAVWVLGLVMIGAAQAQEPVLDACGLAVEDIAALAREDIDGHISPATVAQATEHLKECLNGLVGLPDASAVANVDVERVASPDRKWTVKSNWSAANGGLVALSAGTKGYPHNVGGYLWWTQDEGLRIAECLNESGAYPAWYASPGGI